MEIKYIGLNILIYLEKNFIEHILDDVEFNFKEPLQYISDNKYRKSKGASFAAFDVNYFRNFLKNYFLDTHHHSFDFYVNLHNSVPKHIIYNTLGEIDERINDIAKKQERRIYTKKL